MFDIHELADLYRSAEHVQSAHCRAKNINQSYILKICNLDDESYANFEVEIMKAKHASKHKFGPKVISFGYHNKYAYILMEKLKVSLKFLIEKDKLNKAHIKSLKKNLKLMWKRGNFIHMDLHAENIWFDEKGDAKLIDFGIIMDKQSVNDISELKPYILNDKYDEPPITNAHSALMNSTYDIQSLITFCLESSKKPENLLLLQKLIQGDWIHE